jgi:hypothetical protein
MVEICYFCGDPVDPRGRHRHHINHNPRDNHSENVAAAHPSCHSSYHGRITGLVGEAIRSAAAHSQQESVKFYQRLDDSDLKILRRRLREMSIIDKCPWCETDLAPVDVENNLREEFAREVAQMCG